MYKVTKERVSEDSHIQSGDTPLRWYVMLHGNPQLVDFQLKRENMIRQSRQGETPLLEYFIPFCFLSHIADNDNEQLSASIRESNNLREDFHDFIFIHTTEDSIAALLDSDWNKSMRNRLRHYRDIEKHIVIVTSDEMDLLIRLFSERRIKFSIGLPVTDIGPDMNVVITQKGLFNGKDARVISVKHTADGISLTLGISMFGGTKELKLSDMTLSNIQTETTSKDIIGLRFIQEAEQTLLDILSRRLNHKETDDTRREDMHMLNHLFLYSYVSISDVALSARFLSLMLICATLRFDKGSSRELAKQAQALLIHNKSQTPAIRAYLNLALYLATRNADYRTAGKQLIQQHPDDNPSLRRLLSLVRRLRSMRKPNE